MANVTRMNPDGRTFRVPLEKAGEFRVLSVETSQAIFGDIVNRLGAFEKLGKEPEELEKICKKIQ